MDIELDPGIQADLEFVASKTMIPAAELAGALITAGLHGWAHPLVRDFWIRCPVAMGWPEMGTN